jgi:hypothetical protein
VARATLYDGLPMSTHVFSAFGEYRAEAAAAQRYTCGAAWGAGETLSRAWPRRHYEAAAADARGPLGGGGAAWKCAHA